MRMRNRSKKWLMVHVTFKDLRISALPLFLMSSNLFLGYSEIIKECVRILDRSLNRTKMWAVSEGCVHSPPLNQIMWLERCVKHVLKHTKFKKPKYLKLDKVRLRSLLMSHLHILNTHFESEFAMKLEQFTNQIHFTQIIKGIIFWWGLASESSKFFPLTYTYITFHICCQ